jgi:hypothetical protein
MENSGIVGWAPHIINVFMDSQATKSHYILSSLFQKNYHSDGTSSSLIPGHYSRWDPSLDSPNTELDNTSPENLTNLKFSIDSLIHAKQDEFLRLAHRLSLPKDVIASNISKRHSMSLS